MKPTSPNTLEVNMYIKAASASEVQGDESAEGNGARGDDADVVATRKESAKEVSDENAA